MVFGSNEIGQSEFEVIEFETVRMLNPIKFERSGSWFYSYVYAS